MIVTQLSEISRGRYRVYVENEIAFILYRGELKRLGIREGEEIPEESFREIQEEILPKRARKRAMNLLQRRDYTAAGLREKLRNGDYPEASIEDAIAYVESYGYIDDLRYARDFILYHLDRKSRTRIEQDLQRKGIDRKLIERVFTDLEEAGTSQDEETMIRALLQKKKYDAKMATIQEKQRMYAFLYRRGFHSEAINRALSLDIT